MTHDDLHGHALSGATPQALDLYEQATQDFRCYVGDPLTRTQQAIAAAPGMTMAHVLAGWLLLLSTESPALPDARAALNAAAALPATEREALHVQALGELAAGRWQAAGRVLEDLSIRWPRDLLALQVGHQIDFFTGHSRMLRDRIARALPAWQSGMPGHHALLSMHAFGLEEMAEYAAAERAGKRAVELEPRDGWAWHAVAHVMEMQSRRSDGIAWLRRDIAAWTEGSFFAVHNAWHLALFHLGAEQIDEALAVLDERVLAGDSALVLEMIDASAMLWRLHLRGEALGIDLGARWQALADRWTPQVATSHYAFNDFHAMMAFAATGREGQAQQLLATQAEALHSAERSDNPVFLREVGHDASRALLAFAQGRYGHAVQLLRSVRPRAQRFGGSHAQRDLIDLTLIEAAARDGQHALADALRAERAPRA